jgi:diadenosine tetraphosphate (Ap4A) HIT family hydrolase
VTTAGSPFLERAPEDWVASNSLAFAIHDAFPVSPGHTLVVPRRLFSSWFEATAEERAEIFELVDVVRRQLDASDHPPQGYNIGINVGAAAGQTVPHLHVHVIPRYAGDVSDPRGGVRHVIPGKGNYLAGE